MSKTVTNNIANFIVAGVGSGACRTVNAMAVNKIENVGFVCIDTDEKCLSECKNTKSICIGETITRCFGSGKGPGIGRAATEENWEEIETVLSQADMVFVIACFGGGTGTGAAPLVAHIAKETGKLTVGIAVQPFSFESETCLNNAGIGTRKLRRNSDSVIVVNNDGLFEQTEKFIGMSDVLSGLVPELWKYVKSVVDIVNIQGIINLDFADIKMVFENKEMAYVGVGNSIYGDGDGDVYFRTTMKAINNPLMEMELETADYVLVQISGNSVGMDDSSFVASLVEDITGEDSVIILGVADSDTDSVSVSVIASRIEKKE